MNIFFLHETPKLAAQYHCDKHVIKMILESAQLLSTAHRVLDGRQRRVLGPRSRMATKFALDDQEMDLNLYASTHVNHPCAAWVRESNENYQWLYQLMLELNKEFVRRFGKEEDHLTIRKLKKLLSKSPRRIPRIGFTKPPTCMPPEYQVDDVVLSYRNYYIGAKQHIAQWTNSPTPNWFSKFSIK